MGVDAVIILKYKDSPTQKDLKTLQYNLLHRFDRSLFYWERDGKPFDFLKNIDREQLEYRLTHENFSPNKFYEIEMMSRYYGVGYERGDGLQISGLLLYLTREHKELSVFYGGDSGTLSRYSEEDALDLLNYFLKEGNLPYANRPESISPSCSFCDIPMSRYGFGGSYAAFKCSGCGGEIGYSGNEYHLWADSLRTINK